MMEPTVVTAILLVTSPQAAQDLRAPRASTTRTEVEAFLAAPQLDRARMRSIAAAGKTSLPYLVEAASAQPARRKRALRTIRLIDPTVASRAIPALLRRVSRDPRQADPGILRTLAWLAPAASDPTTLDQALKNNPFQVPNHTSDRNGFIFWIDRMQHWYRFRHRLTTSLPKDTGKLIALLQDDDPLLREYAASRLASMGAAARAALKALGATAETEKHPRITRCRGGALTADFRAIVRDAARVAIARIDPTHWQARRGLELLVADADDPYERSRAVLALGQRGEAAAMPTLLSALDQEDPLLVADTITAIGMIGKPDKATLVRLRELETHEVRQIRARAQAALRSLGK